MIFVVFFIIILLSSFTQGVNSGKKFGFYTSDLKSLDLLPVSNMWVFRVFSQPFITRLIVGGFECEEIMFNV